MEYACSICGNDTGNKSYQIPEMMFGFRDVFDYIECAHCGCLQIVTIPENIQKYYPKNYYSFGSGRINLLFQYLSRKRDYYALFQKGIIGHILQSRFPNERLTIFSKYHLSLDAKILDVGCGWGTFLRSLNRSGYTNLVGIDPFIDEEYISGGLSILKKSLLSLNEREKFDCIIFNHSFEHMPDQYSSLRKVHEILCDDGFCSISMPVKTPTIWKTYGAHWVQIDAPRHFFINTLKSFDILSKKAQMSISETTFNSNEFQFWGSEQYKRNIPLTAANSYSINPRMSIFSKRQIKQYRKKAQILNSERESDQAIFILRKEVSTI